MYFPAFNISPAKTAFITIVIDAIFEIQHSWIIAQNCEWAYIWPFFAKFFFIRFIWTGTSVWARGLKFCCIFSCIFHFDIFGIRITTWAFVFTWLESEPTIIFSILCATLTATVATFATIIASIFASKFPKAIAISQITVIPTSQLGSIYFWVVRIAIASKTCLHREKCKYFHFVKLKNCQGDYKTETCADISWVASIPIRKFIYD